MTPEDFDDAEIRRANRSLADFDWSPGDVKCNCDDPACEYDHRDCGCHRETPSCDRHGVHLCNKCLAADTGTVVLLSYGEHYHRACLQAYIDEGELTRDDLSEHLDTLAAHGITFPEAPSEAAAE